MNATVDWRAFFDAQAETYEENPFTGHTAAEVDFFLKLFPLPRGASLLDVGCGTGRHARELSRRGYRVVGIDLSPKMIEVARRLDGEGKVEFLVGDARDSDLGRTFDAALCLCEGGVGLLNTGESAEAHDGAIFANSARHLVSNAPFLLTMLNGYAPLRKLTMEHVMAGGFDPATMRSRYDDVWDLPTGETPIRIEERLFIAPEVAALLHRAGFRTERVLGGTAGHWGLRPLDLDEIEAMFVCRRRA
ncbi:class I SAM-dependent methyltransferase [bacterium]|nr:MAG: class I SAM-dependent methyltransferase [bacterium]